MEKKYRIKKTAPSQNLSSADAQIIRVLDPKINRSSKNDPQYDKRFQSQIIKPLFSLVQSRYSKPDNNPELTRTRSKTYQKLNFLTNSELKNQSNLSQAKLHLSYTLNNSLGLRNWPISPSKQQQQKTNQKNEIQKFPYYVSKSYHMIETKQKLLQMKHKIRLDGLCPILQSIQDSVNGDRAGFCRKMKLQLYRKGNYDLVGYLQKDLNDSLEKQEVGPNSLDKQRQNSSKFNLSHMVRIKYKDRNQIEKLETVQKMQETKRRLKILRKNNITRHNH